MSVDLRREPAGDAPLKERKYRPSKIVGQTLTYLAAAAVGLFALVPLYWMFITSLKPRPEIITRDPVFWPSEAQWSRYPEMLERGFSTYLTNSIIVAVSATVLGIGFSTLAGYALARMNLPLKKYLLLLVLSTQMFPAVVLLIPLFVVMRNLDLLDTHFALIFTYMAFTTPLAIWILRGFFLGIPEDLENAALVDGCTRWGAVRRIVLPLAGPGIAASSIFVFIAAWNEFMFALTFTSTDAMRVLPVALQAFIGQQTADHGMIMAASTLFTMPVVIFFLFVHKRLTTGMVAGSVKG